MQKQNLLMIVILALLVLLIGAVGTVSFFGYRLLTAEQAETTPPQFDSEGQVRLKLSEIEKVQLSSEITTNLLTGPDGAEHYVKVQLAVGVNNTDKKESPEIVESLSANETVTRDIVLGILRSHTYEDLRSADGQDLLKENIKLRLSDEYDTHLIVQVYISDLVLS